MVWIADNNQDVVTAFDPEKEAVVRNIKVKAGISGDDIAVGAGAVFTWNADVGVLTQIDADRMQVVDEEGEEPPGYQAGERAVNERSDLAVDEDSAWVTDPAGEAVYKIEY